ncbi:MULTISPECIES: extracellular solute-binding protein [unclassified Clostridium]|uniref:extracellular solute-binding protein n=1 Tax=unclassified Clostridium TaxID=2614128 RepID=UPI001FA91399|nr:MULTISPECIES: extracellular solute-binding protein [unclassified Clostridium]
MLIFIANLSGCSLSEKNNAENQGKITLTMWHIWSQTTIDANGKIVQDTVEEWNKANPNVQIKVEAVENERYKAKIKTAFATNELPDIFYSWGGGFSKPFIESGKVLNLNEYLDEETKDKINKGMLNNITYDNSIYGLPMTLSVGTFYCNTKLFSEANIKIPDNYDEFIDAVKAFKNKGITPLLVGEKDNWTGILYYDMLALREGGIGGVSDSNTGTERSNSILKAAYKLKELVDLKAFNESSWELTRDESEMLFKRGEIPMYFTGNWFIGELKNAEPSVRDNVIVKTFPVMKEGKGTSKEFLGGAVDHLMISNNSKYKKEAVAAAEFIAEEVSKKYYEFGSGLPAWNYTDDASNINKLSKELEGLTENASYSLYGDIYLGEEKGNKHKELVLELFKGQISPEDFAKEMEKIE